MSACDTRPVAKAGLKLLSNLKPFPPVARELMSLVTADDIAFRRVADLIRADAAFSAEMLRLANSPLLLCRQRVYSVLHALAILGLDRVKGLVMTVALRNFLSPALHVPVLRRCWRHSMAVAFLAEEMAKACDLDRDQAYTAGLLHDVGRLVIMASYPAEFARLLEVADQTDCDLAELERTEFGVDHYEAGRWLVTEWEFPPEFVAITANHRGPIKPSRFDMLSAVRLSCRLADMLGFQVAGPALLVDFEEIQQQLPATSRDRMPPEDQLLLNLASRINALECSLL